MIESLETRRKRLRFRSWHRGTKEMDLLLGGFADRALDAMDADELDRYEALLEVSDPMIYGWIAGHSTPPAEYDHEITRALLAFRPAAERS